MRLRQMVIGGEMLDQHWRGIPTVEITVGGRLFVSWFSGGDKEPSPDNAIFLQTSDNGGYNFSTPVAMVDPEGNTRAFDPALWLDPRGVLWFIWSQDNLDTTQHGIYARYCMDPDADTPVWSSSRRLGYDVPHCFRSNKPTVLSSQEWLMPVTWAQERTERWFPVDNELQGVGISRDCGQTWELHGGVNAPPWALENMIIEKADGTIVMYIRTGAGVIWQSISEDRGLTWSKGQPTSIPNPGSRFFLCRLASGRWLLISNPNPDSRTGLHAYLSQDEGQTWTLGLVLDEREEVSYPDATQTEDDTIYAVYDRERYCAKEILLSVFHEDDLLG